MIRPRISGPEGVIGELTVESYNRTMRGPIKKRYFDTSKIIKAGITSGTALEIGSGPGYLGIDWLTKTSGTFLKGLDLSEDMINIAKRNAAKFKVESRVEYVPGNAMQMIFKENTFDAVFSNGSLHEWSDPTAVLDEIHRVLKPGGFYYVSDLRRNMTLFAKILLLYAIPKERKKGFHSSVNASYTQDEIKSVLCETKLNNSNVANELWTIVITGRKGGNNILFLHDERWKRNSNYQM